MTPKEYALLYLKVLKWSVVPVVPMVKKKKPFVKWAPYQNRLPTEEEIEEWWKRWPDANVGIITGKLSGILCVDIDSPKAQEFYISQYGEIHNTARQTTGKPGGMHLIFNYPTDGKLYPNVGDPTREKKEDSVEIDIRGEGGFFVACPSIHLNGTKYSWILDPTEDPDNVIDLPEDVKNLWGYIKKGPKAKPWEKGDKASETGKSVFDLARYLEGADEPGFQGSGEDGRLIGRDMACVRLIGYYLNFHDPEQVRRIMYGWSRLCRPVFPEEEVDKCLKSILDKRGTETLGSTAGNGSWEVDHTQVLKSPDGGVQYRFYIKGYDGFALMEPIDLVTQTGFRTKIMMLTNILIPPVNPKKWPGTISAALKEAEIVNVSPEDTILGTVARLIKGMTSHFGDDDFKSGDVRLSLKNDQAVPLNGSVYFTSTGVKKSLLIAGEKLKSPELYNILVRIGAEKNAWSIMDEKIKCWKVSSENLDK